MNKYQLFFAPIFLLLLSFFPCNDLLGQDSNDYRLKIPLTNFSTTNHAIELFITKQDKPLVEISVNSDIIRFNQELPVKILELNPKNLAVFSRPLIKKGITISLINLDNQKKIQTISIPKSLKKNGYFRGAYIHSNDLYFINYNPKKFNNSLTPDKDGDINVLHRIKCIDNNCVYDPSFEIKLNNDIDIRYGIDRKIFMSSIDDNHILVCSGFSCSKVDTLSITSKSIHIPENNQIIELITNNNHTYSILHDNTSLQYCIVDILNQTTLKIFQEDIPFNLKINDRSEYEFDTLKISNRENFLKSTIIGGKDSGILELGMDNDQARVAWSSVYYLNSFIDILHPKFEEEFSFLSEKFKSDLQMRLSIEMYLMDLLIKQGVSGIKTSRYSTKQQEAVYAVQSGRILRLLKRYQSNFIPLVNFDRFEDEAENLKYHEEIFYYSKNNDIDGLPKGRLSLKWPKAINFPFDGFKIPFNHQDDWAAGVTYGTVNNKKTESRDIILTLLENSNIIEANLDYFEWKYWYGRVTEPWSKKDALSKNTPNHYGDKSLADISYRTIDAMALLTVAKIYPEILNEHLFKKIIDATQNGLLFPFIQEDLDELYDAKLKINDKAVKKYLVCDSAWCVSNLIWALKDFNHEF